MGPAFKKYWKCGVFLTVLTAAVISVAVWPVNQPAELVAGGVYVGDLPLFGKVQVDLFTGRSAQVWIYREGVAEKEWFWLGTNTDGSLGGNVLEGHSLETNAVIKFHFAGKGEAIDGSIAASPNTLGRQFVLKRIFEHAAIERSSEAMLGRIGANTDFEGQFPLLPTNSEFKRALNRRISDQVARDAGAFTSGNLERHWEILRYGSDAVWGGTSSPQWQVRFLNDSIASFAVWDEPYYGGCGTFTKWAGRNYAWHNGKVRDLKLQDLFETDSGWDVAIRNFCSKELRRQEFRLPAAAVFDSDVSLDIFTLSSTGLQIYFNPYEISGGADGEFIIHIPYACLQRYYKRGWPASLLPIAQNDDLNRIVTR